MLVRAPSWMDDTERFMSKVVKTDYCWFWNAAKSPLGYGVFSIKRKTILAHRVSYMFFRDDFNRSLYVCHSCDNPSRVNPEHLWLGTAQDNMDDKHRKGRYVHGSGRPPKKLQKYQVDEIVKSGLTTRELSITYGVSGATILKARRGLYYE